MKKKMLVPDYLMDFKCIGSECTDSCCSDFTVPVGKQTYDKYQNIDSHEYKTAINKYVIRNLTNKSDIDYAFIDAKCDCPFLSKEGLCSIQMNLGESYLSSACSKYPRQINAFEMNFEKSATLSCPEIARLVITRQEGISFIESEEEIDERDMVTNRITKNMAVIVEYFEDLRDFTMYVLKDRSKNIESRLDVLYSFFSDLDELIQKERVHKTPDLISDFISVKKVISNNETDIEVGKILETIISIRDKNDFVKSYQRTFDETLSGFLNEFNENVGFKFLSENQYILENYLVNYVFKHMFPFSYGNTFKESVQMLQLHSVLLQVHVLGVGSYLGRMDMDIAVRVIQSWVKEAEHSSIYMEELFQAIIN